MPDTPRTHTCHAAPIVFRGLDHHAPLRIYRRHLPHWRQDGATYFVTFRLADSIPATVAARWQEDRRVWLAAHGLTDDLTSETWQERYGEIREADRRAFERESARHLLRELDACHGACTLRMPGIAEIVAGALRFHDGHRLRCGDFVVMPNHVHWLVQPMDGENVETLEQSVKRFSATRILTAIGRKESFWQKENYDRIVRDVGELTRIRQYIAANPGHAGAQAATAPVFAAEWCCEG